MYVGDQVVDSLLTATYEVLPEGDGIFGYYEVTLFEEGTWWATGEIGGPYTDVAVSLNGFLAGGQSGDFAYVYGCRTSEEDGEAYLFLYQPPRDVAIWSWLPNQAETAPFGLLAEAKLPDRPEFDLHYLDARCTFSGGQTLLDMYYNQEPTPVLSHVDDQPLGTSFDAVLIGGRRLVNADADIQLWYDDLVVWRPSQ
jgi:hypothetical protein